MAGDGEGGTLQEFKSSSDVSRNMLLSNFFAGAGANVTLLAQGDTSPAGATSASWLLIIMGATALRVVVLVGSGVGGGGGGGDIPLTSRWPPLGVWRGTNDGWYSKRQLASTGGAGGLLLPTLALAWPSLSLRTATTLANRATASSVSAATGIGRNASPPESERTATSFLQLSTAARLASSTTSMTFKFQQKTCTGRQIQVLVLVAHY
jgi:hypothetical protein